MGGWLRDGEGGLSDWAKAGLSDWAKAGLSDWAKAGRLLNSLTFRIVCVTGFSHTSDVTVVLVRLWNRYPNLSAASTSAASSGDAASSRISPVVCAHGEGMGVGVWMFARDGGAG
jgi:hypothetical protein